MARIRRQTVDFFQHDCNHGKTIFILEQKWGNDGYAFWFKILELLGSTDGHYIDCRNEGQWAFLQAKTRLSEDSCNEILDTLAKLQTIDGELWQQRIIWSSNFVQRISHVYSNRRVEMPTKPNTYKQESTTDAIPTSSLQIGIRIDKKERNIHTTLKSSGFFDTFWKAYPSKVAKVKAEQAFVKINPDEVLLEAIIKSIEKAKSSIKWQEDNGKYIPNPATWLNQKRWNDIIPDPSQEEYCGR